MADEEITTPESTGGVSTEVESQVAAEMAQAKPQEQSVEQVIETPKAPETPVETPAAQTPSTVEQRRVLPSEFYNKRQISKLQRDISSLKEMIATLKQPATQTPSATKENQPPNYEESFYKDPVGTMLKAIQDKIALTEQTLKNDMLSLTERQTQAKAFETEVQEASRMVVSNDRVKSNPNFEKDIIDVIEHYGLEHLGKVHPKEAIEKAIEIYDALIGKDKTLGNPEKKSKIVNTQTAVRSTTEPSEKELINELRKIQDSIVNDPSMAMDSGVGKRLSEINAQLEKLSK